ncbi:hypothetical protein ACJJTC_002621 [Scirpophaga incertulas]
MEEVLNSADNHNLCFYDNITKDGYCFVWNESEGGLNAEEFASIWTYFIEKEILSKVENKTDLQVIIYSDGCGYQNRNVTLSNALLNLAVKNQITITQKYLEVGHTQMELDAMHSSIERKMRRTVGDPKVTDIRALMYSPSGNISYKLRFTELWTLLPQRKEDFSAISFDEIQNLHQGRLKIKAKKYYDLQQIKEVLPADFPGFYDNLPND